MTDDIKAIMDALAAGFPETYSFFTYLDACHPERIARLSAG